MPNGAQRLIFTMNYQLREDQVFTILTPNWPNSTSGPRGASGFQLAQNLTRSGTHLTLIGELGPNWSQYIFPNSQSTAQADVMLLCVMKAAFVDKSRTTCAGVVDQKFVLASNYASTGTEWEPIGPNLDLWSQTWRVLE